jgi:hypothetical protein
MVFLKLRAWPADPALKNARLRLLFLTRRIARRKKATR